MGGIFDKKKVDEGISAVCDAMNGLGLNLFEQWWVARHVSAAAEAILGPEVSKLAEKWSSDGILEAGAEKKGNEKAR